MAKSSTPSRVPRNAPQSPKEHRYIGALVRDDFGRMSQLNMTSAHAWAKKKLDHASQSLQLRNERIEKQARRAETREYRRAEAGLQAELRESDHRTRLLARHLKTRVKPEKKLDHTPPRERKRLWPYASVALPKYDGPVLDRRGERGVFARFRYYSRRTALAGVSQRVLTYCYHGAELDASGNPYVHSNVGETIDEALCAFDHLEQVNWSASSYAKLLVHGILAMDHRQTPDEMMEVGVQWAEEALGRFCLPYLVTLHAPPPDGDQRNWHCHVLWSYRPLERIGDHEWEVGEMLRTDLDNPQAMKLMREMFAAVMTNASFEAGQNQVWTAKSNADRGMPNEPQTHLGGADTNRARNGEHIADNEENHQRVLRSKAAMIDDDLRHLDDALAHEQDVQRSIRRRWARLPVTRMRLPQGAIAATLTATLQPAMRAVLPGPPIVVPSPMPRKPVTSALVAEPIAPLTHRPLPPAVFPHINRAIGRTLPASPSVGARVDFANLRKPANLVVNPPIPPMSTMPAAPPRPAAIAPLSHTPKVLPAVDRAMVSPTPTLSLPVRTRIHPITALSAALAVPQRTDVSAPRRPLPFGPAAIAQLQPFNGFLPDVPMVRLDRIHAARRRLSATLIAADERRKREDAEAAARIAAKPNVDPAVLERRRQIAEACRILLQSPRRPYRIAGNVVTLDLDVMGRRERYAVTTVGMGEREVVDALVARARRDRDEDERAKAAGRSSDTPSLNRLTILSRIADQRDAATRDWVTSRRCDDPAPAIMDQSTEAPSKQGEAVTAAAIAARLRDNQRD